MKIHPASLVQADFWLPSISIEATKKYYSQWQFCWIMPNWGCKANNWGAVASPAAT